MIILAIVLAWLYKAPIASYLLSSSSGVEVSIQSLGISSDGFTAYGVRAHEKRSVTTLTFRRVRIETDPTRIFNSVVTIKNVQLDDVTVESDPGKIDIEDIGSLFGSKSETRASPPPKPKAKRFIIQSIEANNIKVKVQNPFSDQTLLTAEIPEARFSRVNRGDPVTLEEALQFLTKQFQLLRKQ